MKDIIEKYIKNMMNKHGIVAAMVTGSYVTGNMGPRSDIDLFFIAIDEYKSCRGREFFQGVEFEYFISPEWKYYDRLRKDTTAMRIYSTGKILYDPENRLDRIQKTALQRVREYKCQLKEETRKDYKFWIETICKDGEDLFDGKDFPNFLYFTGCNLPRMSDLMTKLLEQLPIYEKYGVEEITEINRIYGEKLSEFLITSHLELNKKNLWIELCNQLSQLLGDIDITNYESIEDLIHS